MKKREWTDMKALEPEIVAMRKAGKTHQEIADHFGLSKKKIINWVTRYNKEQAALAMVSRQSPKAAHGKMANRPIKVKPPNSKGYGWRISCCGIFCGLQEGS